MWNYITDQDSISTANSVKRVSNLAPILKRCNLGRFDVNRDVLKSNHGTLYKKNRRQDSRDLLEPDCVRQ